VKQVPIADGHGHSNPIRGLGASKIARNFKARGGWFQALVALSPWQYALEFRGFESYKEAIEIHIRECKAAEGEGVKVACIAGFHPADVDHLIDRYNMKPSRVLELGYSVADYVSNLCSEGVLDGIGEVGRQHYKTGAERVLVAQLILERALENARDHDCVVHMHLENAGPDTVVLTHKTIERLGVYEAREKLVFHHSKPSMVMKAKELGYPSTVPGVSRILEYVFTSIEPTFMVESDYIDDPSRPGAVVYPWEMAENELRLLRRGVVGEDYLYKINVDNIIKLYNVEAP